MMLPPPPSPSSSPLTSAGKCFRSICDYCLKEVDDPMVEKKADALLVAASVVAAMNYQVALSPPGGTYEGTFRNNGTIIYEAGQAISAYVTPYEYRRFCIANTISFTFSMTTMFLFLSGLSLKRRIFSFILTASMFGTITATTYSYKLAMEATTPDHDEDLQIRWHFISRLVTAALISWFVVAGIAIVVFIARLLKPSVTTVYRRATLKT